MILVTGGNGGIGNVVANYLISEGYEVLTTDINGGDIVGDLTDQTFRAQFEPEKYDALINCAGYGIHFGSNKEKMDLNATATCLFIEDFYNKMKADSQIINITARKASDYGHENHNMESNLMWYITSKAAITRFTTLLQKSRRRPVKITNLEPDWIKTTSSCGHFINPETNEIELPEQLDLQTMNKIPMDPLYIASVVHWVLTQPIGIHISTMVIENRSKDET